MWNSRYWTEENCLILVGLDRGELLDTGGSRLRRTA